MRNLHLTFAFLLICLGLAECTTLRRPGDKALKDAIKCFRTTLNAFEEVTKFKDENQIVKAIHFALLQVAIQKFRLNNEIMADKLEDSVATIKFLGDLHKVFDEIGHGTCSRQEFNFKTCFDVDGPRSKELKKMGKNGDPCPSLDFLFSCTNKYYTEQE